MLQTSPSLKHRLAAREIPSQCQVMSQKWRDLLFLHWVIDPQILQEHLPKGLHLDLHHDLAYIGIVPFFMEDVKPHLIGGIDGMDFPELNLRIYVYDDNGVPGVYFFSLDAASWLAVKLARLCFHLPYYHAKFKIERDELKQTIHYQCTRGSQTTKFDYRLEEPVGIAEPGSLDFFLIERYVLFTEYKGKIYSGKVNHHPYPLWSVKVEGWDDKLMHWAGLPGVTRPPDHVIGSKGVDVSIYGLERHR